VIHLEKENPDKAEEAFNRALRRDPQHVNARINLARILYEKSDYANRYNYGDRRESQLSVNS